MAVEFRKNLVKEFSEKFVLDLEAKRWKVDKVKNFETLLEELKLK